jgi:hypothetical protein
MGVVDPIKNRSGEILNSNGEPLRQLAKPPHQWREYLRKIQLFRVGHFIGHISPIRQVQVTNDT